MTLREAIVNDLNLERSQVDENLQEWNAVHTKGISAKPRGSSKRTHDNDSGAPSKKKTKTNKTAQRISMTPSLESWTTTSSKSRMN